LIAQKLLEVETISREEFESIFPSPFGKNGGTPMPVNNVTQPIGQSLS